MIEFITNAILVTALICVVAAWIIFFVVILWDEIKAVYNYYKEQRNVPADPR